MCHVAGVEVVCAAVAPSRSHTARIDVIPRLRAQVNGSWSSL
jgi:hypothetical protein